MNRIGDQSQEAREGLRLLTVQDVARQLNVSEACIRKWVLNGRITYKKVGKAVRFTQDDIDRKIQPMGGLE